jgi:hypothetical protein
MSKKSKGQGQKGAFGGTKGKTKKAQMRWMANRGLKATIPSLPGSRLKIENIMDEPTTHVTQR